MSYDFFVSVRNFQKLLHNHLTLADTGLVKEHDNTSEDKFSACYWHTEVCCNLLLSASQIKIEDGAQDHCILRLSVQA